MNAPDFRNEYLRLARGFNAERAVTDERLRSMFGFVSNHEIGEMQGAVERLLTGERMPTFDKLHAELERQAERTKARRVRSDDVAAGQRMDGVLPRVTGTGHECDGARLFADLCRSAIQNGQSPESVAPLVDDLARRYPSLTGEADSLRRMGAHWRNAMGQPTDAELDAFAMREAAAR